MTDRCDRCHAPAGYCPGPGVYRRADKAWLDVPTSPSELATWRSPVDGKPLEVVQWPLPWNTSAVRRRVVLTPCKDQLVCQHCRAEMEKPANDRAREIIVLITKDAKSVERNGPMLPGFSVISPSVGATNV